MFHSVKTRTKKQKGSKGIKNKVYVYLYPDNDRKFRNHLFIFIWNILRTHYQCLHKITKRTCTERKKHIPCISWSVCVDRCKIEKLLRRSLQNWKNFCVGCCKIEELFNKLNEVQSIDDDEIQMLTINRHVFSCACSLIRPHYLECPFPSPHLKRAGICNSGTNPEGCARQPSGQEIAWAMT